MALVLKDRVKETSTTTGTGTFTLAGASTGFQAFSVIGDGNTTYYTIALQGGSEFEVGIGTYTLSGTTLSRDTVLSSSAGGTTKVDFSAGTKDVFVVQPSEKAVYTDATNIVNTSGNGTNTVSFTSINTVNITATTSNATTFNGTTGAFTSVSGNGIALTAINASNISSGTLSATRGGTGSANLTADNVILGNGANTVKVVAPGTANNVLTSDGTTWISAAPTGGGGAGTITRTDFTATAAQTVFNVTYPVGLIDVYRNGVKLATADFTATNGTSFTLTTAANDGDIVQAEVFNSLNLYETITADTFSGNGVQTTFIMSVAPASPASTLVAISGVVQNPSNYTVSSTSLTFLTAPPSGSNNISARYLGVPAASAGNASYDTATTSTGYFDLPSGTTAQRPASPATGMIRYNTTNFEYEVYDGAAWKALTTQTAGVYTVDYLVVAGGGGGNTLRSGGGGAGGLLSANAYSVTATTAYTVTVGGGGAAAVNGSNSVFNTFTSVGGGRGGAYVGAGAAGGSGGGGSAGASGGAGTAGQGSAGGTGFQGAIDTGGGGGGASAVGANGSGSAAGNGGAGTNWLSLGTSYAGGGGGGAQGTNTVATGGAGGGGNGGSNSTSPTAGTTNTGGGGGGGGTAGGAAGGSGIVIIRYLGSTRGSGGTITSSGGYTYHTFTSSGTFTA